MCGIGFLKRRYAWSARSRLRSPYRSMVRQLSPTQPIRSCATISNPTNGLMYASHHRIRNFIGGLQYPRKNVQISKLAGTVSSPKRAIFGETRCGSECAAFRIRTPKRASSITNARCESAARFRAAFLLESLNSCTSAFECHHTIKICAEYKNNNCI